MMRFPSKYWWLPLGLMAAAASTPAHAAVVCSITATELIFGAYNPAQTTPVDITASLALTCTATSLRNSDVDGTVALTGPGTAGQHQVKNGVTPLTYQLFTNSTRTTVWGNGANGSSMLTFSGSASIFAPYRRTLTVYGRLLARQTGARVGRYTDPITVSVSY